MKNFVLALLIFVMCSAGLLYCRAADSAAPLATDEFVGPLPGWKNLRSDYGAVGDGKADDTVALQTALSALAEYGKAKPEDPYVLYLPAGAYRITKPLALQNRMAVEILGEDPTTTKIIYDGPPGEAMLTLNGVTYSKFGRITWDGQSKAKAAYAHQWNPVNVVGPAATYLEHSDEIFKDVGRGIIGGLAAPIVDKNGKIVSFDHGMDAECLVRRCKFVRCSEAGLSIESMNALDWWIWDSEFIDCYIGATNSADGKYGGGHFHLYRNLFRGSKESDISLGNCSYFGFRLNTSLGSRRFLETLRPTGYDGIGTWSDKDIYSSKIAIQHNRILNPTDPTPIWINQNDSIVLLDNTFVVAPSGDSPVLKIVPPTGGGDLISLGNKFFGASRVDVHGGLVELDNEVHDGKEADLSVPTFPPFAPRVERQVISLMPTATADDVQKAIDAAAALTGSRPVVHLAAGDYHMEHPLRIPAGADLQFIGDGMKTTLIWEGVEGGTMLTVDGPTRVVLRDFSITQAQSRKFAKLGLGILADNVDQEGGRIELDQVDNDSPAKGGFLFDGIEKTRIQAWGSGTSSAQDGVGVTVKGDGTSGQPWVAFFGGAASNNLLSYDVKNGGNLLIWDSWYETAVSKPDSAPRFIHLTDSGNLTYFNGKIATLPGPTARRDFAAVDLDGFRGNVNLIGANFTTTNPDIRLGGDGQGLSFLALGIEFSAFQPQATNHALKAQTGVLACTELDLESAKALGGKPTDDFLRTMLVSARTVLPLPPESAPAGATDLHIHRVQVRYGVANGVTIQAAKAP